MPTQLTSSFANFTGLTPETSLIVLWIILCYLVLIIILIPLHKALLRLVKRKKEKLTREYDTLRYLVAKAQKQSSKETENKGIKVLFASEHPDYLHHYAEIRNEVLSIETSLGTKIIDDAKRTEISRKQKGYTGLRSFVRGFGRIISVPTLFMYKLFW